MESFAGPPDLHGDRTVRRIHRWLNTIRTYTIEQEVDEGAWGKHAFKNTRLVPRFPVVHASTDRWEIHCDRYRPWVHPRFMSIPCRRRSTGRSEIQSSYTVLRWATRTTKTTML